VVDRRSFWIGARRFFWEPQTEEKMGAPWVINPNALIELSLRTK